VLTDKQKVDESEGNVHSGARPPWLEAATDVGVAVVSAAVIGPTADDLHKHCMSVFYYTFLSPTQYVLC